VRVSRIIKEEQPKEYSKLKNMGHSGQKKEKLTEYDIEKLMNSRSYRRGKGGAIKQVSFYE